MIIDELTADYPAIGPHVELRPLPTSRLFTRHLRSTATLARYIGLSRALVGCDAILTLESYSTTTAQALWVSHSTGVPVLPLVYELISDHPIYTLQPYRSISRFASQAAAGFIAVTAAARDHLIERRFDPALSTVVHPGVVFGPATPRLRSNSEGLKLLFLGRLAQHKGFDTFLDVYDQLTNSPILASATVIGDGPYRPLAEQRSATRPDFFYLGQLDHRLVLEEASKHDVLLAPYRDTFRFGRKVGSEQFGFGIVEAMASGLAIITTKCGAMEEIVGPSNFTLSQGNYAGIIPLLSRLNSNRDALTALSVENVARAHSLFGLEAQAKSLRSYVAETIRATSAGPTPLHQDYKR
ncbi:MAG: glycosyltransferase [Actinomycetota bacterium]|nr:glycosyltransferase [Actinomycetota bacterium]